MIAGFSCNPIYPQRLVQSTKRCPIFLFFSFLFLNVFFCPDDCRIWLQPHLSSEIDAKHYKITEFSLIFLFFVLLFSIRMIAGLTRHYKTSNFFLSLFFVTLFFIRMIAGFSCNPIYPQRLMQSTKRCPIFLFSSYSFLLLISFLIRMIARFSCNPISLRDWCKALKTADLKKNDFFIRMLAGFGCQPNSLLRLMQSTTISSFFYKYFLKYLFEKYFLVCIFLTYFFIRMIAGFGCNPISSEIDAKH